MTDSSDFTRLAELLISRQDQQQQQIDLLLGKIDKTDDAVARIIDVLARHQEQTDLLLEKIDKTDRLVENLGQVQSKLIEKIDKTDKLVESLGQVQNKLIEQLELIYNEQQRFNTLQLKFNDRQEKFNDRQDQFNIIFLDEIRGLKKDVKLLIEVVMQRHEERLKRLEDFMDGFMRQAG